MKILVTGGAGFIGSHLTDSLIEKGHEVTIFDNLTPQVHKQYPSYLNKKAVFIKEDIRNKEALYSALKDSEAVFHLAATVGVGQSMYEIANYTENNIQGTANLLDILVNKETNVKKVLVASSMSAYGEGDYICYSCNSKIPKERTEKQMKNRDWEIKCSNCNSDMKAIATNETKKINPSSIYAITKYVQEEMVLQIGKTYGLPSVALRLFNTYGTRQSLSNAYTGVLAIFLSRIKNNNPPLIFEDGNQLRDFVSVKDIVQAFTLCLESSSVNYDYFNVGSGKPINLKGVVSLLSKIQGTKIIPEISHKFRVGDVRHCYPDISKIKSKLDFEPRVDLESGLKELHEWSKQEGAIDDVAKMKKEMEDKKIIRN